MMDQILFVCFANVIQIKGGQIILKVNSIPRKLLDALGFPRTARSDYQ